MKRREITTDYSRNDLVNILLHESGSTSLLPDAAHAIVELVADDVENWLADRTIITEEDYERVVYEKIKKYNHDLAYIYLNRDKII